ncbi:MAG: PQQ-dependent dehydrogenase, methanol/ethanol family [Bryobacteraceae bacterium]
MKHAVLAAGFAAFAAAQNDPGQQLYTAHCVVCHGATAEGGSGPDLTSVAWHASVTDDQIDRAIRDGKRGTAMPAFGDKLDATASLSVVKHLRKLSATAMQPTTTVRAPEINVASSRLVDVERSPDEWLMYGRDYGNRRFSPHEEIHVGNVKNLVPMWSFQTGVPDGLQATPLFVNGVLYLATAWNHVFAIDARTGAEIWHYRRRLPEKMKYCCGPVNRGVAVANGLLYLGTLDAHMVALNARDGRVVWDVEVGKVEDNFSITSPPLIAGNKVITGIAGGDFASRGFIAAYDAASGRQIWRFHTIPEPGPESRDTWSDAWKTGGAATWMNGSFDPELNLVYWGTGNPFPVMDGGARKGDNLYSDSVVVVNADTGKLAWYYQYTPNDVWDYDGVNELVFIDDLDFRGRKVKAVVHADRNGHFYALDRKTGEFLYAKAFVRADWLTGFDDKGHPMVRPSAIASYEGTQVCPGAAGGKEWNAMSYSPLTRLVYVPVIENCAVFSNYGVEAKKKGLAPGPSGFRYLPGKAYGKLKAIRVDTGESAWEVPFRTPAGAGTLVTAGGLVFSGEAEGSFVAYDAKSGERLWSYQTGSGIRAAPISYRLDGKQYIAIASGLSGAIGGYTGAGAPWMKNYRSGGTLYVFRLFEAGASSDFHGGAR